MLLNRHATRIMRGLLAKEYCRRGCGVYCVRFGARLWTGGQMFGSARCGQTTVKSKILAQSHDLRPLGRLKRGAAVAAIAIWSAGASLVVASTAAQAQVSTCNLPSAVPSLNPHFFSWGPSAVCAAASAGTSITSAVTTLDIAFLTQTSAFVGSPSNPLPDQLGGGV